MATAKKAPAPAARKNTEVLDMQLVDTSAPAQQHPAPALQSSREVADTNAPPPNSPMAGALAFLQAGGKPEQLEQMMTIHERWQAGEARKMFADAMAAFKQNPPIILKDKAVYYETKEGDRVTGAVGYKHATLGAVVEAIVFGLAQHGITHRWETEQRDGRVHVTCILTHKAGHSESTKLDGAPDSSGKKNPIQQVASTVTYLQRYTLLAATGLATKDMPAPDDDGKGAGPGEADPTEGIDADLLQRARDASLLGWDALAKFIKRCTEEERLQLDPVSASLKGAALLADKESTTRKENS